VADQVSLDVSARSMPRRVWDRIRHRVDDRYPSESEAEEVADCLQ